ncbi:sigma-70 family RNA polymerase sigma factor [Chitinophaga ginsengisegetis]|uniref:RNA polymerase sigma factor n=1 Tax=Chitinophaga ginsengisegetis TaxID=393003 RepID=UPI00342FA184
MNSTDLFLAVLQTNKGIIYKIAQSYCQDAEERKDLVQEIITQLWRSFGSYTGQVKYSTWIYRIALNVAISFYRKGTRRKQASSPFSEDILHIVDTNVKGETAENIGFLQRFIAELKELDKALMLLYLEEKSYREIGEIMGLSETNVATKIARIKGILKQKFSSIKT